MNRFPLAAIKKPERIYLGLLLILIVIANLGHTFGFVRQITNWIYIHIPSWLAVIVVAMTVLCPIGIMLSSRKSRTYWFYITVLGLCLTIVVPCVRKIPNIDVAFYIGFLCTLGWGWSKILTSK